MLQICLGYLQASFPGGAGHTATISVSFNTTKYTCGSAAEVSRTSLINTFGWTITDGGSTCMTDFDFFTEVDRWFDNQALSESMWGLIDYWNVSQVTDMNYAFSPNRIGGSAINTFNENISSWNTSSVVNMSLMFYNSTSFNQPLNWDTSSVIDMSAMFASATSFNQPLNFDTSIVTTMAGMFNLATSFNSTLTFDTSSVLNMQQMFQNAASFNQPLAFDTSSVTNMLRMFYSATSFNQPLNWDVSSVATMQSMFFAVNFSTTNYDLILVYWEAYLQTAFPSGVGYTPNINVSFNTAQYTAGSAAATARASLISNFGWNISDNGSV